MRVTFGAVVTFLSSLARLMSVSVGCCWGRICYSAGDLPVTVLFFWAYCSTGDLTVTDLSFWAYYSARNPAVTDPSFWDYGVIWDPTVAVPLPSTSYSAGDLPVTVLLLWALWRRDLLIKSLYLIICYIMSFCDQVRSGFCADSRMLRLIPYLFDGM